MRDDLVLFHEILLCVLLLSYYYRKTTVMQFTAARLCSLSLLIGLTIASTVPPTGSHDIHTVANKNVSTDKPTNHKTGVEHIGNVTHTNHTGMTNHTNHTDHSNDTHHEDHTGGHGHGEASIHVFTIDFTHVKYPVVFGLVVIIAALSKLGKFLISWCKG